MISDSRRDAYRDEQYGNRDDERYQNDSGYRSGYDDAVNHREQQEKQEAERQEQEERESERRERFYENQYDSSSSSSSDSITTSNNGSSGGLKDTFVSLIVIIVVILLLSRVDVLSVLSRFLHSNTPSSISTPISPIPNGNIVIRATSDGFRLEVNVRSGAGTGFSSLGKVYTGDYFTLVGQSTGQDGMLWYEVNYYGQSGFIRSDLVYISN